MTYASVSLIKSLGIGLNKHLFVLELSYLMHLFIDTSTTTSEGKGIMKLVMLLLFYISRVSSHNKTCQKYLEHV